MSELNRTQLFLELLGHYGRRVRFVGSAFGSDISRSESHILIELKLYPGTFAAELSERLLLEQSSVSRAVANLRNRKLIRATTSRSDRRVIELSLTKKGEDALHQVNKAANGLLREFVRGMARSGQMRLGRYLKQVAAHIKAPAMGNTGEELEALLQIRRITRPMGALGESFFGTPYSLHHWHILSVLDTSISIQELSKRIALSQGATSDLVKRYEKSGFISCNPNPKDRRSKLLERTAQGFEALNEIRTAGRELFEEALQLLSVEEYTDFTLLLAELAGVQIGGRGELLSEKYKISELCEEQERRPVRGFVVQSFLKRDDLDQLPSRIVDQEDLCFRIDVGDELQGYCELRPLKKVGVWELHLFELEDLSLELHSTFATEVARRLGNLPECKTLLISPTTDRRGVFAELLGERASEPLSITKSALQKLA